MKHTEKHEQAVRRRSRRLRPATRRRPFADLAFKAGIAFLALAGLSLIFDVVNLLNGSGRSIAAVVAADLDAYERSVNILAWCLFAFCALVSGAIAFFIGKDAGKYIALGALGVLVIEIGALWIPASAQNEISSRVSDNQSLNRTAAVVDGHNADREDDIRTAPVIETRPASAANAEQSRTQQSDDSAMKPDGNQDASSSRNPSAELLQRKVDNVVSRIRSGSPVEPASIIERVHELPVISSIQLIARMAPDHFTIQLLTTDEERRAIEYITKHELRDALYFEVKNESDTQYKLILGHYETFKEGSLAIANLNEELLSHNPWVRRYGAIQKELGLVSSKGEAEDETRKLVRRQALESRGDNLIPTSATQ